MESWYLFFGLALVLIIICLLVVFFVSPKAFPRKEFMGFAWPLVKQYFWRFAGIILVYQVLVNLPSIIAEVVRLVYKLGESDPTTALFDRIATMVISVILQAGMVGIALQVVSGNAPRLGDLFSQTKLFWRYLGGFLLSGLIAFGGLLLLVIPGIIWSLKFSQWPYFLVEKNVGIFESFRMSSRATAGYKGSLFVLHVYLGALTLLGLAAAVVGLFVTTPLVVITLAWAYRRLSSGIAPGLSAASAQQ